tara:strand:+ start:6310 stop:7275 length:966 start_codon:yes stop_codon:yes gene_type:complete
MTEAYFFFDYNKKSGIGHYKRCSVIAKELLKKNIKSYLICFSKNSIRNKINYFNFVQYEKLKTKKLKNNFLIIDSYLITNKKLINLKNIFDKIYCIEDQVSNKFLNNFAIINPSFEVKNKVLYKNKFKKIYLGIKYKFIDQIYQNKYSKITKKKNITISFGGGKTFHRVKNFLNTVFICLEEIKFKETIYLFLDLNLKEKKFIKNKYYNLNIKICNISNKYYERILQSKFVISSCGIQQDELISWKIPSIFLKIAENQKYNFSLIKKIDKQICYESTQFNSQKLKKIIYKILFEYYDKIIIKKFEKIPLGSRTSSILRGIN